jgi:hypothetical protein
MKPPYAFVGDLHGRVNLLHTILDRDPDRRYHYIFLGDIIHHKHFFRFNRRCSPVKMLREISELVGQGRATLVLGNHENCVLDSLVLPADQIKKKEVRNTLESLKELSLSERLKYISMLSSAPISLELPGNFRLAHAYYPHTPDVGRKTVLFGPGYAWFKEDLSKHAIDPDYTYFFGHYGLPYRRANVNVIDATNLEATGVYYSDRDESVIYY